MLDPLGTGFDLFISLINHSCLPSCYVYVDQSRIVHVKANKRINSGDQITISYTMNTFPTKYRQDYLNEYFFFTGKCKLCTSDVPFTDALKCVKCGYLTVEQCKCGYTIGDWNHVNELIDECSVQLAMLSGDIPDCYAVLRRMLSVESMSMAREPILSLFEILISNSVTNSMWFHAFAFSCIIIFDIYSISELENTISPLLVISLVKAMRIGQLYLKYSLHLAFGHQIVLDLCNVFSLGIKRKIVKSHHDLFSCKIINELDILNEYDKNMNRRVPLKRKVQCERFIRNWVYTEIQRV